MHTCFCRTILSLAIVIIAIFWWPAEWAKWVVIVAGALLALASLFFFDTCCCGAKKEKKGSVPTHGHRIGLS